MAARKKGPKTKTQRDQKKLLDAALKRPGVAAAADTYSKVQARTVAVSSQTYKTGYATGGNIA